MNKETTVAIEKNVDKEGTFTMKVTLTTKTNTTSGSKLSEEKYTYQKKNGKFYYAVNESDLSEKSETLWAVEVVAYSYSASPLNILTGQFMDYDTIKNNVTEYTQKGINLSMHSQKENQEYILSKVLWTKELSSYQKTTSTYQDNVLQSLTTVNYSFKKR